MDNFNVSGNTTFRGIPWGDTDIKSRAEKQEGLTKTRI